MGVKFLTVPQVLAIHDRVIKQFGGLAGIQNLSLLESAISRPQSTYNGKLLYSSTFEQAAVLLHSLAQNHAFVDGNKRTALTAMGLFLKFNGWSLTGSYMEELELMIKVGTGRLSIEEVISWLQSHTKRTVDHVRRG